VKGKVLLYKNTINFRLDRRLKVSKFDGSYKLMSKKVVYMIDNERFVYIFFCYKDINGKNKEVVDRLRDKKCFLITGPSPATAFQNKKIAFLYTPLKFVIELIES
jgi:hypothetical protein